MVMLNVTVSSVATVLPEGSLGEVALEVKTGISFDQLPKNIKFVDEQVFFLFLLRRGDDDFRIVERGDIVKDGDHVKIVVFDSRPANAQDRLAPDVRSLLPLAESLRTRQMAAAEWLDLFYIDGRETPLADAIKRTCAKCQSGYDPICKRRCSPRFHDLSLRCQKIAADALAAGHTNVFPIITLDSVGRTVLCLHRAFAEQGLDLRTSPPGITVVERDGDRHQWHRAFFPRNVAVSRGDVLQIPLPPPDTNPILYLNFCAFTDIPASSAEESARKIGRFLARWIPAVRAPVYLSAIYADFLHRTREYRDVVVNFRDYRLVALLQAYNDNVPDRALAITAEPEVRIASMCTNTGMVTYRFLPRVPWPPAPAPRSVSPAPAPRAIPLDVQLKAHIRRLMDEFNVPVEYVHRVVREMAEAETQHVDAATDAAPPASDAVAGTASQWGRRTLDVGESARGGGTAGPRSHLPAGAPTGPRSVGSSEDATTPGCLDHPAVPTPDLREHVGRWTRRQPCSRCHRNLVPAGGDDVCFQCGEERRVEAEPPERQAARQPAVGWYSGKKSAHYWTGDKFACGQGPPGTPTRPAPDGLSRCGRCSRSNKKHGR
eukprot:TRINITY_DN328_c0_g1_i1.p1 TRINITY_DN328_c0_g1~~TRINITY_DN328_c0_g1_i1.p1  ORF type:complete len:602 (-),score=67.54 TRINITY_DN328_c0_g1_i1:255-2060(-)